MPRSTPRALRLLVCAAAATLACTAQAKLDPTHPAVARALAHLQTEAAALAGSAAITHELRDVIADADGTEHVRFARRYQGLRVIGGDVVVHGHANGSLRDLTQTVTRMPAIEVVGGQSEASVQAAAAAAVRFDAKVQSSERVIYARAGAFTLAHDVRVINPQTGVADHVIVDAASGRVLDRWSTMQTALVVGTGNTQYSGTVSLNLDSQADGSFALRDLARGGHEVWDLEGKGGFLNSALKGKLAVSTTTTVGDGKHSRTNTTDAAEVHHGHAMTWDFYQNVLGRSGIADDGKAAYSRVHSGMQPFGLFYNASWNDDCFCMTYSWLKDANNPSLTSVDVAGHEMTHGVTSRTAGLIYSGESGGINESMSDMMGNMVEWYANNPVDVPDAYIGEQMNPTNPLRNMATPSSDGSSADCYYPAVGSLDVHYSSGVGNHFFYMLVAGTNPKGGQQSTKTCQAGDTKVATGNGKLKGIGALDSAKIMYTALTKYMTSDTNYAQARVATIKAATDLFGASSRQTKAVGNAWTAVNVN